MRSGGVEKCDRPGPRIGRSVGVVDRARVVVKSVAGSLVKMKAERLAPLNDARKEFGNPAILVVIGFRKDVSSLVFMLSHDGSGLGGVP